MKLILATLLSAGVLASGCAQVKVKPAWDANAAGVPFYEPRPYLLVSRLEKKDGKTGDLSTEYSGQIIYLPNYERRYSVQVKPGWGSVDGSLKLVDGWRLESLGAKSDSKVPETISAVSGLLKEAVAAAAGQPQMAASAAGRDPVEGLYLIKFLDGGTVRLVKQTGWNLASTSP